MSCLMDCGGACWSNRAVLTPCNVFGQLNLTIPEANKKGHTAAPKLLTKMAPFLMFCVNDISSRGMRILSDVKRIPCLRGLRDLLSCLQIGKSSVEVDS